MDFIPNGKDYEDRSGGIASQKDLIITSIKLTIIMLLLFFDDYFEILNLFFAKSNWFYLPILILVRNANEI